MEARENAGKQVQLFKKSKEKKMGRVFNTTPFTLLILLYNYHFVKPLSFTSTQAI
jgi:hypothetical protein